MPTVVVEGVGVVTDPVPPVAELYHNKVLPVVAVAVSATATAF